MEEPDGHTRGDGGSGAPNGGDAPRVPVTVYGDTVRALETALRACRMVEEGESADPGHRDEFVRARVNLRILAREIRRELDRDAPEGGRPDRETPDGAAG